MLNTYEQELFIFFSSEDNFVNLCRITSHLPMVKQKLLEDFWQAVEADLNIKLASKWTTRRLEPIASGKSKLIVYKEEWGVIENDCPQLGFSLEGLSDNPFYGPLIHNRVDTLEYTKALEYFRKLPDSINYQNDNSTWYPFWNYTKIFLGKDEDFIKLIPKNRIELVEDVTNKFAKMINELEMHLDFVHQQFRRQNTMTALN